MLTYTIVGICIGLLAALLAALVALVRDWQSVREAVEQRVRMGAWGAGGGPQRHSGGHA